MQATSAGATWYCVALDRRDSRQGSQVEPQTTRSGSTHAGSHWSTPDQPQMDLRTAPTRRSHVLWRPHGCGGPIDPMGCEDPMGRGDPLGGRYAMCCDEPMCGDPIDCGDPLGCRHRAGGGDAVGFRRTRQMSAWIGWVVAWLGTSRSRLWPKSLCNATSLLSTLTLDKKYSQGGAAAATTTTYFEN